MAVSRLLVATILLYCAFHLSPVLFKGERNAIWPFATTATAITLKKGTNVNGSILPKKRSNISNDELSKNNITDTTNVRHETLEAKGIDATSIFDKCSYPSTKGVVPRRITDSRTYCTYFRPTQYFFHRDLPGYPYRDLLNDTHDGKGHTNLAIQLNNWVENIAGPRMRYMKPSLPTYKSVTVFPSPKSGSLTIRRLFLDHLALPKQPVTVDRGDWNFRRLGSVDEEHCRELERRQKKRQREQDGIMGEDVVVAVVRDPVTRFFSAVAELTRMTEVKAMRCRGCMLYFQPCLYPNTSEGEIGVLAPVHDVLMCTIDAIRKHGFFDAHVIPQSFFISRPLSKISPMCDIEIAVFPIHELDRMAVEGFSVRQEVRTNDRSQKKSQVGKELRYLLEQMDSLLYDGSIDKQIVCAVCLLYEIDVKMMRYLKIPLKYCTDYCMT